MNHVYSNPIKIKKKTLKGIENTDQVLELEIKTSHNTTLPGVPTKTIPGTDQALFKSDKTKLLEIVEPRKVKVTQGQARKLTGSYR